MLCLAKAAFWGFESSAVTQKDGKTKPMATPIGWKAVAITVAITRSFSPNHRAANFPGAQDKKGCPIAAIV